MRPVALWFVLFAGGCSSAVGVDELEAGLSVCAKGTVTSGIDVSHHDGTIAWPTVKAGGIAFAIIKATEETTFVDPQFATNWSEAGGSGLIRGAYHFFRPKYDPIQQADFFVATAGVPIAGELPLTIDLETTDSLPGVQVAEGALQFLQRVEQRTGRKPLIYTSASFFSSIGNPAGFDSYVLWTANWQVTCPKIPNPPWADWTIWQSSSTGTVPGISRAVDLDSFNGMLSDLQMFVGTSASGGADGGANATGGDPAGADLAGGTGDTSQVSGVAGGGEPDKAAMAGGCSVAGGASTTSAWMFVCVFLSLVFLRQIAAPRSLRVGR